MNLFWRRIWNGDLGLSIFNTSLVVVVVSCGIGAPFFVHAEESNTSEASVSAPVRSSDRFLRRLIIEGSFVNIGYEESDSGRYSKPNGYSAGALVDIIGREKLVLETGVVYRQLGTNVKDGLGDNLLTANYLSIPLNGKFYFSGQEETSPFLKAGVMGSTLISNNTIYTTSSKMIMARSWETALVAGAGMKFNFSSSTDFLLEVDYTRALETIFPDSNIYRSELSAALGMAVNF